jgi:maltose-binding protein MalE
LTTPALTIDQFGFSTFCLFWQPWVWSTSGSFFEDHSALTLNEGAALEGPECYVGRRCEETPAQAAHHTAASMFADGDAAMILDGRWRVARP